ncbi:MAG: hypothetical protein OIF38_12605 [Cellvibrionaceae bacterium]|nr:hypothetical protein [Cellvibrionaceae bacterium]
MPASNEHAITTMSYCRYHPNIHARFYCPNCHYLACSECVDEVDSYGPNQARCFHCKEQMDFLGGAGGIEPFWRRFGQAFRYPLHSNALWVLGISTAITLLGWVIPLLGLLATAFLYKYCFSCLERTAHGQLQAPQVVTATSGGLVLLLQIVGILSLAVGSVVVLAAQLSPALGIIWAIFVTLALPAAFMILAMNQDFGQAVDPRKHLELIGAMGPGYFILWLLLLIMSSSVGALQILIGEHFLLFGYTASVLVSSYYAIVMFHLMGYAIFQYQDKLGFSAQEQTGEFKKRGDKQRLKAKAGMLLKDGEYEQAANLYHDYLQKQPRDSEINELLFNLLVATSSADALGKFAEQYFNYLFVSEQLFKVSSNYRRLLQLLPNYTPSSHRLRSQLAEQLYQLGDFKGAARLLKNYHQNCSNRAQVIEAYQLMLQCLNQIPKTEALRQQYQNYIDKLVAAMQSEP